MRRAAVALLAVAVVALGCASPRIDVDTRYGVDAGGSGRLIEVKEFEMATTVQRYDGPAQWISVDLTQRVVSALRARGLRAIAAERTAPDTGDYVMAGRIVKVDGGSQGARQWAGGYGAGGGYLAVEGDLRTPDGRDLGTFATERRSSAAISSVDVINRCARTVARDVAGQVAEKLGP